MSTNKTDKKKSRTGIYIGGSAALLLLVLIGVSRKKTQAVVKKDKNDKLNFKKMTKDEFIKFLSPSVKVISAKTGIPYKFMMAQMALETGWGKSELFYKHFNVGGIRSFKPETEKHAFYWTREHVKKEDLPKWDKYERDKTADKPLPNGKVNIKVKLPFMSYNNLVEGLQSYLNKVLLNRYFKPYIAESKGDANKYVELLQSGKYGAKYATAVNYVPTVKALIPNFA